MRSTQTSHQHPRGGIWKCASLLFAALLLGFAAQGQANCWTDAACNAGNPYCNEKRGAVTFTIPGTAGCSGALVNNTRNDFTPYLLTAFHCIDSNSNWALEQGEIDMVQNIAVTFRRQLTSCNGATVDPMMTTINGGQLVAADPRSDMALILLDQRPPLDVEYFYLGWDHSDDIPSSGASIHHPGLSGSFKKISTYSSSPTRVNHALNLAGSPIQWIRSWKVGFDAATYPPEQGSSGGPLLDESRRVIGIVSHGDTLVPPGCPALGDVYFGRFAKAWDLGNSPGTRLEDWLDPDGTGATTLNGIDPCQPSYLFKHTSELHVWNDKYDVELVITAKDDVTIANGRKVRFNAGNYVLLKPGFRAAAGSDFRAFIQGCDNPCTILNPNKIAENTPRTEAHFEPEAKMLENFPNPFTNATTIRFRLKEAAPVTINVYNQVGQLVRTLASHQGYAAGSHDIDFDREEVPAGIYIIHMQTPQGHYSHKMILND